MIECPTCGRDDFEKESAMKIHHTMSHNESLVEKELTCSSCGDSFTRPEYDVVEADNYYCSYECRKNIGQHECPHDDCNYTSDSEFGIKQHHKRSHGVSLTTIEIECDNCGEKFKRQRSKDKYFDGSFCSKSCRAEHTGNKLSQKRTGDGNPMYGVTGDDHHNYKGGYGQNYGKGWLEARRKAIDRDDEQCVDCGMIRSEHYDEYGFDLEVHHKTPIRTFNDTEEANELSNLVTLCVNCHQKRENS